MKKALVLLNEQHSLMEDQERVLNEKFDEGWEIYPVPAEGWPLQEMANIICHFKGRDVVFASPIPFLITRLSWLEGRESEEGPASVRVFHNDNRVAREVPDGKGGVRLIHSVAPTGWKLVS